MRRRIFDAPDGVLPRIAILGSPYRGSAAWRTGFVDPGRTDRQHSGEVSLPLDEVITDRDATISAPELVATLGELIRALAAGTGVRTPSLTDWLGRLAHGAGGSSRETAAKNDRFGRAIPAPSGTRTFGSSLQGAPLTETEAVERF
jgi:hypothetical protein